MVKKYTLYVYLFIVKRYTYACAWIYQFFIVGDIYILWYNYKNYEQKLNFTKIDKQVRATYFY